MWLNFSRLSQIAWSGLGVVVARSNENGVLDRYLLDSKESGPNSGLYGSAGIFSYISA